MSLPKFLDDAAKSVAEGATDAADFLSKTASEASEKAGEALSAGANVVVEAGGKAVEAVGASASAAINAGDKAADTIAKTAGGIVETIKYNSPAAREKRARLAGFQDGMCQGANLAAESRFNYYYAYVSTLCYVLRTDGVYSEEEQEWLSDSLSHLRLDGGLPNQVKENLKEIAANEALTFDDVKTYLDKVSIRSLESIAEYIINAIELDGEVTYEEIKAKELFDEYISTRTAASCSVDLSWNEQQFEKSIEEYSTQIDQINKEFKERTKLQGADIAFLAGATLLQVARVLIINAVTQVEKAGAGNIKEDALHDFQEKLLKNFDQSGEQSGLLYASTHHIVTARGVPYDATAGGRGLFKGANHRFSTLGHDPLLGLIFGTSNIMTNSISCVKDTGSGLKFPVTFSVAYDFEGKNPHIDQALPVGTLQMLSKAGNRIFDEPSAAAAALIKQIIHIGTDLYTPCGIQLSFANILLDKKHVEKLTSYVNTGDVLKVGAQAGISLFINWLVAALHGCSLIFKDDGEPFSEELYQTRTKKIVLISNTIATSSSVVQTAITKNPRCLDLGGAIVLAHRLFTDLNFITKLKEEYLTTSLHTIYEQRAQALFE